jgi:hypothetical protein
MLDMHEMEDDWCSCTLAEHFVTDGPWLCIPCFFVKEVKATRHLKRNVYSWEMQEDGQRIRKLVSTVSLALLFFSFSSCASLVASS